MYSLSKPLNDSFAEPSALIVISLLLLVLNSEYSFVASNEGEFIKSARKPIETNTNKDLYIFFISFSFIKLK